jgi:zinc protease
MLNRKLAPPFQKTLSLTLPKPTEILLRSGSKFYHLEGLKQNIVKIEVIFSAGKWAEGRNGLSHFTSVMLEKGTVKKTSVQVAGMLDRYGASLEISPGFDFVTVALYSLKVKIKDVFPLFLEILTDASFPEKEWMQLQEIFIQNLKINNEKTSYLASKLIRKNIFGAGHPYGTSIEEADVLALKTSDLHQFFRSSFSLHSAYAIGDLTTAEIEFIHQGLNILSPDVAQGPLSLPSAAAPFLWRENKEGALQSSIRLGKRSLLKDNPEYADVLLVSYLLGGFFGSRLMKNIREEKGLTYGISSSVNTFKNDSLLVIGADVNKDNVSLAVSEIKKELKRIGEELVEAQELLLAKNHFIGSLQTDMANLFAVEEKIKNIHLNNLPEDYYQKLLARVDSITAMQILSISQKYFGVETLFEVVAG